MSRRRPAPQQFKPRQAFKLLVAHLREREEVVRFLAVTTAMERWVQFEAAALIDRERDALGIGGELGPGLPRWWIAVEHRRRDLWLSDQADRNAHLDLGGVRIEFKSIHNNKNYLNRVASIRADLSGDQAVRCGILVVTYAQYPQGSSRYRVLRDDDRTPVRAPKFWKRLRQDLGARGGLWGETTALDIVDQATVTSLQGARYVDPEAAGCEVRLILVSANVDE